MFFGYCFLDDGSYMPKVSLTTAEDAFRYCQLQSQLFPEVRITDEDDCCVMHVMHGVLKTGPWDDGSFHYLDLTGATRVVPSEKQF